MRNRIKRKEKKGKLSNWIKQQQQMWKETRINSKQYLQAVSYRLSKH